MHRDIHENTNASGILDYASHIFKKTFWYQIASSLIVTWSSGMLIFFLIAFIGFLAGFLISIQNIYFFITSPVATLAFSVFFILQFLSILVIFYAFYYLSKAASTVLSKQVYCGERISLYNVLTEVVKSAGHIFTLCTAKFIVYTLEVILFILVLGLYTYFSIDRITNGSTPYLPDTILLFTIGFIIITFLLSFITIFINTLFSLALPVAMFEKKHFFGALQGSYRLVIKDKWLILGLVVIGNMIVMGAYFSLTLTVRFIPLFANIFLDNDIIFFSIAFPMIYSIFTSAISAIITPIISILYSSIYFRQRTKHEGLDVEVGMKSLVIPSQS